MNNSSDQPAETQTPEELPKGTEDKLRERRNHVLAMLKEDDRKRIGDLCDDLDKIDRAIPLQIKRENYKRNHEFLSQQIDERSHQVWMLGSLFVPLSFLIFMYTATSQYPSLLDRFLLMSASLTSYLVFYYFYRRITLLNDLSYDYLHAYELELGLSGHITLKKYWDVSRFLRFRVYGFVFALIILSTLWTGHLLPEVISYKSLGSSLDTITQVGVLILKVICFAPFLLALILHSAISYATNVKRVQMREHEAREQRKSEQTSSGSGAGGADSKEQIAETSVGSQQPPANSATPQPTTTHQDKGKEDFKS